MTDKTRHDSADAGARVTIRDGLAEAEVAPAVGGCLTAFRWRGGSGTIDWLRPAPPGSGFAPTDSACFPLVPYSNRIRDGRFTFLGRGWRLTPNFAPAPHTIHGHGWKLPWRVEEHRPAELVIAYRHNGSEWPAPYRAEQRFSLAEGALAVEIAVTNEGETPMPAGLGLHPYFPRTPDCRVTAAVGNMWATDIEVMPTELVLPPSGADPAVGLVPERAPLDNCFTGFAGDAVIDWPEAGRSLALQCDPALGFLVIYTPPGRDFFCVEPVSHCTDAVNLAAARKADTGLQVLEPGERFSACVTFRPQREGPS